MAARRGKNQAKRSGKNGLPGGAMVLIVVLAGAAAFGWWQFRDRFKTPANNLPTPDPQAQVRGSNGEEVAPAPDKPKMKYDFFDLLPGKEVVIPDAELNARAQAEAAARARAAAQAGDAQAAIPQGEEPPTPSLILDSPAPSIAAPAKGERYLIQAGAFRGSAEAEALKAKIALTGEIARVEVAQINGNTVHRVRMGPYPDASALAAAKQALASHGIDAQAIKVK